MKTYRVLFISLSAIAATLLLSVLLNANRGTATAQGPNPPSGDGAHGDGQISNASNWPTPLQETGPDAPNRSNSPGVSFSYYHTIGTLFQPRKSTSTYDYTTNGCMYQNGGTEFRFQAHLVLPEDSVIKYVRIYYNDTVAQDMTVWLTRYDPGKSNVDLTSVQSSGSGGYGTALSALITETVDLATYAYVLTWGTGVATSGNQLCGIRVAYYAPPIFGTFVPVIQKNP